MDKPNFQGNAAVNYTDRETPWIRIIEHEWFECGVGKDGKELPKTVISREYSSEWKLGDEPYYPLNDETNNALYQEYRKLADKEEKIIFGSRLGEYHKIIICKKLRTIFKKGEIQDANLDGRADIFIFLTVVEIVKGTAQVAEGALRPKWCSR